VYTYAVGLRIELVLIENTHCQVNKVPELVWALHELKQAVKILSIEIVRETE